MILVVKLFDNNLNDELIEGGFLYSQHTISRTFTFFKSTTCIIFIILYFYKQYFIGDKSLPNDQSCGSSLQWSYKV